MMEILLPLRNPTDALTRTIDSLLQQTRQDFTILLSDNHSVSGQSLIKKAQQKLAKAGLGVRLVRPPMELQRVEHWNWLHFQSQADWLKPLFAGDELPSNYMATVRREIERNSACSYVYSHDPRIQENETAPPSRTHSASEMQQKILRGGIKLGPSSVVAYRRDAFVALGGYRTTLPIGADSLLLNTLAARFDGVEIQRSLRHVSQPDTDVSLDIQESQAAAFREKVMVLVALFYHAYTENVILSRWNILRWVVWEFWQHWREKRQLSAS